MCGGHIKAYIAHSKRDRPHVGRPYLIYGKINGTTIGRGGYYPTRLVNPSLTLSSLLWLSLTQHPTPVPVVRFGSSCTVVYVETGVQCRRHKTNSPKHTSHHLNSSPHSVRLCLVPSPPYNDTLYQADNIVYYNGLGTYLGGTVPIIPYKWSDDDPKPCTGMACVGAMRH